MQHHLVGYIIAALLIFSGLLIHCFDWDAWLEDDSRK